MEKQSTLEFTKEQKKHLEPFEQSQLIRNFRNYDKNGDGTMDAKEFKKIMIDLGYRKITDDAVQEMLTANDKNHDGVISWSEFVDMQVKMMAKADDRFGKIVEGKEGIMQMEGQDGASRTYSIEERSTFAKMINENLKDDEDCQELLPMEVNDDSLFHVFDNGIMLCKLMMAIDNECLDSRAINRQKNMNVYEVIENLKMGIAAAKGLGIKMIGVDPNDFIKKKPHMILGCLWQALRRLLSLKITLKDCPEIMRLAKEGEELKDLNKLPVDQILIRWVNFHLEQAGEERRIQNLGKDLKDSFALFKVLNQLDKKLCPLDGIDDEDLVSRAEKMIANSIALGVPDIVNARDITTGNVKVNTLFVAYIFNHKHGLEELTDEEYAAAGMLDDDIEGSHEERSFRIFINSLGIEDVHVNNLYDDCNDGLLLCKVCDKIDDKCVNWKKVERQPKNDFGKNINNNTAIEACKNMGLKMIGIGGVDITKGDRKNILATVWQIVKCHYLKLIGGKTEKELIEWANNLVGAKMPPIKDFKDESLQTGKFMIEVCAALEPRSVNWDLVMGGETDEEKMNNAKYAISIARKLGAVIFCVWEDIAVKVNPKQMLIFFATMNEIQIQMAEAAAAKK